MIQLILLLLTIITELIDKIIIYLEPSKIFIFFIFRIDVIKNQRIVMKSIDCARTGKHISQLKSNVLIFIFLSSLSAFKTEI